MNTEKVISWRNCDVITKKGDKLFIDGFGYAKSGEILAVMGPSGSGKSTFFNLITGNLDEEQIGTMEVRINGEVISDITKTFSYYSYKHQSCLYYHYLTAYEILEQIGYFCIPDAKERKERINNLLQSLDLVQVTNSYVENLSSGQKERLFIAMSIMNPTDILILDEPFSKVDTQIFLDLIRLIMAEKMKGRIVIFSIHVITPEIEEYIDNLMLISEGRVVYFGYYSNVIEYFNNLPLGLNVRSIDEVISAVFVRNEFGVQNTDDVLRNRELNVMAIENYSEPYLELYEDFSVKPSNNILFNFLWYYHTLDAFRSCYKNFKESKLMKFITVLLLYFSLYPWFFTFLNFCCPSIKNFKSQCDFLQKTTESSFLASYYKNLCDVSNVSENNNLQGNFAETTSEFSFLQYLYYFLNELVLALVFIFIDIPFFYYLNDNMNVSFLQILEWNKRRGIYSCFDVISTLLISSFIFRLFFLSFFQFLIYFYFLNQGKTFIYSYLMFIVSVFFYSAFSIIILLSVNFSFAFKKIQYSRIMNILLIILINFLLITVKQQVIIKIIINQLLFSLMSSYMVENIDYFKSKYEVISLIYTYFDFSWKHTFLINTADFTVFLYHLIIITVIVYFY